MRRKQAHGKAEAGRHRHVIAFFKAGRGKDIVPAPPVPAPLLLAPPVPAAPPDPAAELARMTRLPRRIGAAFVGLFVAVFVVFAGTAPIAGGAVAPARVSPDGGVKTVQHLEGGIVKALHVRDGDRVAAGAALVTLEPVQAEAEVLAARDRRVAREAERARLEAEASGADRVAFPPFAGADAVLVRSIVAAEERIFDTRRRMLGVQKRVLNQRINQLREQIEGYEVQVRSAATRLTLIAEELDGKTTLYAKGLAPKAEILRLQRSAAEIEGFRGEQLANAARARQEIGETELQLSAVDAERAAEVATRLSEVRNELVDIEQVLARSADVLDRTAIVSPADGTVTNIRIRTLGGVVQPGEPILDIVPANAPLLLEARVSPSDIDIVVPGLPVKILLKAYSGRLLDPLHGKVKTVAADALEDERTGATYYSVLIEVPPDAIGAAVQPVELVPGMAADVVIVTAERTLLGFVVEPLRSILFLSLRQ